MKIPQLRQKASPELKAMEGELALEIFNLRIRRKTLSGQLTDARRLQGLKRDLARVKTLLTARESGIEKEVNV